LNDPNFVFFQIVTDCKEDLKKEPEIDKYLTIVKLKVANTFDVTAAEAPFSAWR
jgi:hypothetical protein